METVNETLAFEEVRNRVKAWISQLSMDMEDGGLCWESGLQGETGMEECLMKTVCDGQTVCMRVFSMEEIYEAWSMGQDIKTILDHVKQKLVQCRAIEQKVFFRNMSNYEAIRSSLVVRPVNYSRNRERLRDGLFERMGDIALVLYFDIGTVGSYYASSMVPANLLMIWKREWNDIYRDALQNTADLYDVQYIRNCTGVLLSTEYKCNGSIAIFLPGTARRMGELLGHDYYIVFISVHEIVLHDSSKVEIASIRKAFREMEEAYPAEEDFLTEEIFFYDRIHDRLNVV